MNINYTLLAKPNETIEEHTENVLSIARMLLDQNQDVIEKLVHELPDSLFFHEKPKEEELQEFVLELVYYHDAGKVNPHFQDHVSNKKRASKELRKHAIYSFYLWFIKQKEGGVNEDALQIRSAIAHAVIAGHHGSMSSLLNAKDDQETSEALKKEAEFLLSSGIIESRKEMKHLSRLLKVKKSELGIKQNEPVMFLTRFIFSILVLSDSFASSEVKQKDYEKTIDHFLGRDVRKIDAFGRSDLLNRIDASPISPDQNFASVNHINDVRTLANKKISTSRDPETDIYVIESPVGSGKTLSSLSLAESIIKNEKKKKIISVFPLNSVQVQFVETLKNELQMDEKFINVINSEEIFGVENQTSDWLDRNNAWLFERNCLSNEVIVTSHVRFFGWLSGISRKDALGFLSLKDAVVVIDEFQNYPPSFWFSIWGELLILSKYLGTKWIFTTGTFPVSEKQLSSYKRIKKVFSCKEHDELFNHASLKNRTTLEKLNENTYEALDDLSRDLLTDIQDQLKKGRTQFVVCVNFVRHAKALYEGMSNELKDAGFTCYFLCGRNSSQYKRKLLRVIKEKNERFPNEKIVLITTKTVECGMDFDFDVGYKEFDKFDSVEQLGGRVNRSNKKKKAIVKTFQIERRKLPVEKYYDESDETFELLKDKAFKALYENMYENKKIVIKDKVKKITRLNRKLDFRRYKEELTVIKDSDYCVEMIWTFADSEDELRDMIEDVPEQLSYAEHVMHAIKLRKKLEGCTMTVTKKWLEERLKCGDLKEEEAAGMQYFVVCDEDDFKERFVEMFEIEGVVSYLEKNN